MKKSTLFKKIILMISLTLILGLLAGCAIIIDGGQTGTVYLDITNHDWWFDIYLDSPSSSNWLGETNIYGQKTFDNIPIGYHTFYAVSDDGIYSGQEYQYIYSGSNYVDIQVY